MDNSTVLDAMFNTKQGLLEYRNGTRRRTEGIVTPFYPGCYINDAVTHRLTLDIMYDSALTAKLLSSNPVNLLAHLQSDVERLMSPVKLLVLTQFNILLEIGTFTMSPLNKVCTSAGVTMYNLGLYNRSTSGHTVLVSSCFQTVVGISFIGSLCGPFSYMVTQHSWLTLLHELGHTFGMQHTQDGIMGPGPGIFNGVVQFSDVNKDQSCAVLDYVAKSGSCSYFNPMSVEQRCGDGILSTEEECECLNGKTMCGKCRNCRLAKPLACSSDVFVIRTPASPEFVVVAKSALANKRCCKRNKVAEPKTLCGKDLLRACGAYGECVSTCTKLFFDNENCGFDESGCLMGCIYEGRCRYDLIVGNDRISALPNGTRCNNGVCNNTLC